MRMSDVGGVGIVEVGGRGGFFCRGVFRGVLGCCL